MAKKLVLKVEVKGVDESITAAIPRLCEAVAKAIGMSLGMGVGVEATIADDNDDLIREVERIIMIDEI